MNPSLLEGALRRSTALLNETAAMMDRERPGCPFAALLRERATEYRVLLGDIEPRKDAA